MVLKRERILLLPLLVILVLLIPLFSAEVNLIESPKPTHVEKNFKKLVLHKEISADFDEEFFLAHPTSIAIDDECNFFVFDRKLQKIFKFSKSFTFMKCFGTAGNGPGEYDGSPLANKQLYFSPSGSLLLSDAMNKKIIAYDKNGINREEIRLPGYSPRLRPVVDKDGHFFLPSSDGALDVYDKKEGKVCTLLSNNEYFSFLLMEPSARIVASEIRSTPLNTFYDILSDGRLIIYITNSSTVYVLKDFRLQKKYAVIPKTALEGSAKFVRMLGNQKGGSDSIISLFHNFILDQDEDCFYLDAGGVYKYERNLYKLSPEGELLYVLRIDRRKTGNVNILAKRNDYFFGVTREGDIKILKEES